MILRASRCNHQALSSMSRRRPSESLSVRKQSSACKHLQFLILKSSAVNMREICFLDNEETRRTSQYLRKTGEAPWWGCINFGESDNDEDGVRESKTAVFETHKAK